MTMSLTRRLELVNWARQTGAWILEDDYDSEYRYTSRPLAALQGLAPVGRVFYVGTFSKVLFPSLRLGYLVAPAALVDTLIAARTVMSGQAPLIEQAVLAEFMSEGHFSRHLRRMRALYEERQLTLLSEVRRELAGLLDVYPADAGMHTIAWLPRGVRDRRAAALAAMHGVETLPVSTFYKGSCPRGGLMLGFAAFRAFELRKGVQKLARALKSLKGSPTEITIDHISR
jgi:GntR family transcriptional regulator/MocR family aminotransferase